MNGEFIDQVPVSHFSYTPFIQAQADQYVREYAAYGDVVPTIQGLALFIDVSTKAIKRWADGRYPEFQHTVERIELIQHQVLINGGLMDKHNTTITKLMLFKHGYSDKQAIDHRSSDGSMSPPRIELVHVKPDNDQN